MPPTEKHFASLVVFPLHLEHGDCGSALAVAMGIWKTLGGGRQCPCDLHWQMTDLTATRQDNKIQEKSGNADVDAHFPRISTYFNL